MRVCGSCPDNARPANPFRSKLQVPGLRDQLRAEALVRLRGDLLEPVRFVELARGGEHALRPQRDLAIARLAREGETGRDQLVADAQAALTRIDQQQPQLRD